MKAILSCFLISNCFGAPVIHNNKCPNKQQKTLLTEGFSGPIVCSKQNAKFSKIGCIKYKGANYYIYNYIYRFKPTNGNVFHGGQRIIIYTPNNKYLGQYNLSPPPNLDLIVKDNEIIFFDKSNSVGRINFDNGPPSIVHINNDDAIFFK